VIYLERPPAAPLNRWIRALWYTRSVEIPSGRERILPNGCVQIILNLRQDFAVERTGSLVVGAHSVYSVIERSDMADLVGIVFEPGGFAPFVRDRADTLRNRSMSLEDFEGGQARQLRDRLRETVGAAEKLGLLEGYLLRRNPAEPKAVVSFAARRLTNGESVEEVARQSGWSVRRFSQIFREEVGLAPVVWRRVQRFQRAVRCLHAGAEVRWAELALDCGYYDQAHFANEFRAFSGIDATTYSASRTIWANHVADSSL
jgi:AraC-like DNA-binding protein